MGEKSEGDARLEELLKDVDLSDTDYDNNPEKKRCALEGILNDQSEWMRKIIQLSQNREELFKQFQPQILDAVENKSDLTQISEYRAILQLTSEIDELSRWHREGFEEMARIGTDDRVSR